MAQNNNLVTKDYFKRELKRELKNFEATFRKSINLDLDFKIQELRNEIKTDAQKRQSEIFDKLDDFLKEIRDSREERETAGKQIADHETRIVGLEETVFAQ